MITLQTQFPVAIDSDDHKYPEGVYLDNNITYRFVQDIENYIDDRPIRLLDLGCAGGEMVCRMVDRGHLCVGLEGSDHILNVKLEMVDEVGKLPLGWKNWKNYGNKNLFTCDVTKEYNIYENSELMQFDIITSFDVFEHFNPEDVENALTQSLKHLKPNGLFIAQIALFNSGRTPTSKNTPDELDYHKSVFDATWWEKKISKFYKRIPYPFSCTNRDGDDNLGWSIYSSSYLIYCGIKSI